MKLVPANITDIPSIASLAKSIWQDHYIHIITHEQIDYMLEKMYYAESLTEQMVKKNHQFFLVEAEAALIGFVSIKKNEDEVFLNKFYLLTAKQNKGIGSKVFEMLCTVAAPFKIIRLTVNRQNYKAINFYFKNGFTIEKVEDFQIGNGFFMNDFVMKYHSQTAD